MTYQKTGKVWILFTFEVSLYTYTVDEYTYMENLSQLYRKWAGENPLSVSKIPGAGSNRAYYRLEGPSGNVIGVEGTSLEENHAFIYLSRHFSEKGLPVPEVLANSEDERYYIQTDLGNLSLFQALEKGRASDGNYSSEEIELLHRTIAVLPYFQINGAEGLDFSQCYPQAEFDLTGIHFDLNYFKYCFLKATGLEFNEYKLEKDFNHFADDLNQNYGNTFLYRDFQSRNVMIDAVGKPTFIDFQGGRRGPVYYDVASFLWQAAARYPSSLRLDLVQTYLSELKNLMPVDTDHFFSRLNLFVLFRLMQVLGAYGYRGYFERKSHFLLSIYPAIDSLREQLMDGHYPYSYMIPLLQDMCSLPSLQAKDDGKAGCRLVIRIFSFSYKKGIPEDTSGNGGGYVFDCRSTHNPGRYDRYKCFTGLDEPVIRFLEEDGEITAFLDSVYKLADFHVERYLERGFTHLMFSFGCTGGQHRSVYSAQHLAEHLNNKYGVEVRLCHREQKITQVLPQKN